MSVDSFGTSGSSPGTAVHPQPDFLPPVRPARIAILGFGTVGRSVARLLLAEHAVRLRLTHICNRRIDQKRADWVPGDVVWTDDIEKVLDEGIDVLVELIGGVSPADAIIRRALEAGISVVTANKQLIARHGPALVELARAHGARIRFEASVAGGIPVLRAIQEGLAGDHLFRVAGVLNGTCTYILSRMEQGVAYGQALVEAQQKGFAEADPRDDIGGQDAAAKLAILSAVALGRPIRADAISCRPIDAIEPIDFAYAAGLESTIRQVAWVEEVPDNKGTVVAAVRPSVVPRRSALARVEGSQNLVTVRGRFGGETAFFGSGAGGDPTAVAVVSDILSVARAGGAPEPDAPAAPLCEVSAAFAAPHYVRFTVCDRPGIIAALADSFSRHGINIDAVIQQPGWPKARLPFVVTLESCLESRIDAALADIGRLDFHVQPPVALPILAAVAQGSDPPSDGRASSA